MAQLCGPAPLCSGWPEEVRAACITPILLRPWASQVTTHRKALPGRLGMGRKGLEPLDGRQNPGNPVQHRRGWTKRCRNAAYCQRGGHDGSSIGCSCSPRKPNPKRWLKNQRMLSHNTPPSPHTVATHQPNPPPPPPPPAAGHLHRYHRFCRATAGRHSDWRRESRRLDDSKKNIKKKKLKYKKASSELPRRVKSHDPSRTHKPPSRAGGFVKKIWAGALFVAHLDSRRTSLHAGRQKPTVPA